MILEFSIYLRRIKYKLDTVYSNMVNLITWLIQACGF